MISNEENEIKSILILNYAMAPYTTNLDLQKHRSYILIEDLKNFGYIRGNTLNSGKYITGYGDYKINDVEIVDDPLHVKTKLEKDNKNKIMELEYEKNNNKKKLINYKVNNGIIESKNNNINENLQEKIKEEGVVSKNENNEMEQEDDDLIDFNIGLKDGHDGISYKSDEK